MCMHIYIYVEYTIACLLNVYVRSHFGSSLPSTSALGTMSDSDMPPLDVPTPPWRKYAVVKPPLPTPSGMIAPPPGPIAGSRPKASATGATPAGSSNDDHWERLPYEPSPWKKARMMTDAEELPQAKGSAAGEPAWRAKARAGSDKAQTYKKRAAEPNPPPNRDPIQPQIGIPLAPPDAYGSKHLMDLHASNYASNTNARFDPARFSVMIDGRPVVVVILTHNHAPTSEWNPQIAESFYPCCPLVLRGLTGKSAEHPTMRRAHCVSQWWKVYIHLSLTLNVDNILFLSVHRLRASIFTSIEAGFVLLVASMRPWPSNY